MCAAIVFAPLGDQAEQILNQDSSRRSKPLWELLIQRLRCLEHGRALEDSGADEWRNPDLQERAHVARRAQGQDESPRSCMWSSFYTILHVGLHPPTPWGHSGGFITLLTTYIDTTYTTWK